MLNINSGIKQSKTSISTTVPTFKAPQPLKKWLEETCSNNCKCNSQIEKMHGENAIIRFPRIMTLAPKD
jgi:hypothetical protein